jgi:phosphate transport system permease protein
MKNRRKIEETVAQCFMIASTAIILFTLFSLLLAIFIKGIPSLSIAMITQIPQGGFYLGKEGGILNAIVGTLYLGFGAVFLSLCISLPIVLYLNFFKRKGSRLAKITRFSLDVLGGVPSIVYGAFGFTIMLLFQVHASLLAGIITVGLLILPIMARAMDETMRCMPQELLEASYTLGANRFETSMKVAIRQGFPGICTAVLIAFGRAVGDAASLLFTAGFTDHIPTSLLQPVATLPLAIFFQLGSPLQEVKNRGYAAALVLTALILIISIGTRLLSKRITRHTVD